MSFEGYYQVLCTNGHYDEINCYDRPYIFSCRHCCHAELGWEHLVSTTNAEDEENERQWLLSWDHRVVEDPIVGRRYLKPIGPSTGKFKQLW